MLDSFVPKQRRRKNDTGVAPADLSFDLQQTATSQEPDMAIEEEEKHKNEGDGLEDYWKDFALAVESTKV
jgi:DNA repair and recombination protein RAD54 and RAD54-like protein